MEQCQEENDSDKTSLLVATKWLVHACTYIKCIYDWTVWIRRNLAQTKCLHWSTAFHLNSVSLHNKVSIISNNKTKGLECNLKIDESSMVN